MRAGATFWLHSSQLLAGLLLLLHSVRAAEDLHAPRAVTLHTVVPTECTMYFSWQSLGIFYSHKKAGQAGPITRIISCTDEQKQTYKDIDLVPSHVVPSLTVDKEHNDVYSAYNKPGAVMYWLRDVQPTEDFILVIDADMIMRQPFDPVALGAGPGWAISAFFTYMKGVSNELAMRHVPQVVPRNDTLAGQPGRRGDQVGGFTLMHTKDLERVAPLWLSFTTAVRNDPTAWNTTGDSYSVNPGDKPWISEMYGYSYACAAADVWHKVDFSAMLYPAYFAVTPPKVLHYGLVYTVESTNYTFDKHWHYDFDATACPPWDMTTDHPKKGLFPHPPRASNFTTKGEELLRDLLAIQVIVELNVAFCERHLVNCPPSPQLQQECAYAKELEKELDAAFVKVEHQISVDSCKNHDKRCQTWADAGECDQNPGFMTNHCKLACKQCTLPVDDPPETSSDDTHPASPSSLTSGAADTVQKGAAVASKAAGKVLDTGKEAVTSLVTNTTGLVKNLTSGAGQRAGALAQTGKAVVLDEVKQAVARAANAGKDSKLNDARKAKTMQYDDSQFKEAARQVDAEEIADVLEEQAADAEDAAGAEEGLDAEGTAAFKAQAAAERQNLAADAKAKAAPSLVQADPAVVAAQNGGHVTGGVTDSVTNAEGTTKDVQEPDLDLSHADSAPGRHDSIEADSIVKSARKADPTLSLGDSDSALKDPQAASDTGSDAGLHHTAPVLGQQEAVAGSLDHLSKNVVTAAKGSIDDPEQAFTQDDGNGGKQPNSRSQKLELGKGHTVSAASVEPAATFLNKLSAGKLRFTRRIIIIGFCLWILAVIGFLAILRLPRAQTFRRKPLLRRKSQTARQL
ncbi:hypothetical protein ABBQ38_005497 [Trebouxia sp. C0009 RCD-2024]